MITHRYGRLLGDFTVGETYLHPWEVTLDDGMVALFAASFQDALPLPASSRLARAYGFPARPIPPSLAMNLALSFSVHDVSEQAIAHLAYVDMRFPTAGLVGDTVTARSTVVDAKPSSTGDKGVVHVRTVLESERGVLCAFERKALIRAGRLADRPASPARPAKPVPPLADLPEMPSEIASRLTAPLPEAGAFATCFEDFSPGQTFAHGIGHTVGESEHMQLTTLVRNSHPLHFDELYCKEHSFTGARVVYGGLVFSWIAALASRDVAGNAIWEARYQGGAHPAAVSARDTLYAASRVLSVEERGPHAGAVTFALVGVKNVTSRAALERHGDALFEPELSKKEGKLPEKVFEIRRTLLVRKRG